MGRRKKVEITESMAQSKKPKRSRCATEGCRKLAAPGEIFCTACLADKDVDDVIEKVTELEALRFAKLDAEIRNDQQAMSIIDYKHEKIRREAETQLLQLQAQKLELQRAIEIRKPEYQAMVKSLAEKYGIDDPKNMTIDPDTCVIRDLSKT